MVAYARQFIGVPYVYGGTTPAGFDCSGFTQYVYGHFGIYLPRSSDAQGTVGVKIAQSQAQPGDLLWWPGHVGIYTGNGNHIAARNPGTPLSESPIWDPGYTVIRVL
ncbi:MAG: C40 family peptidase [Actinomycetota bacterium]